MPIGVLPALALLAGLFAGRAAYPRLLEWRHKRRLTIGADGIVVGAGPIDLPRSDAPAALLLHGGGDTPQALVGLAQYLHARGFAVRAPLLAGHGRALAALSSCAAEQWHEQVRAELESMRSAHRETHVVGLSMGGALAIHLAAHHRIESLVLLAPYVAMPRLVQGMAMTSRRWGWLLPYFSSMGSRSIRDRAAAERTLSAGILTPAILRGLYDVVSDAIRALPRVKAPTLVVQSREDNRIAPESAELAFVQLGSPEKRFVWTNGAGHVITVDFGHQRVFELTADWLEAHRPVPS